jgi:hypothetical protein
MTEDNLNRNDIHPAGINVYGWCIAYRKDGHWQIDQCDEYRNLPAHYPFMQEALDRVKFLRKKGIECRVAALLAEPGDSSEEFERNRIEPKEDSTDRE